MASDRSASAWWKSEHVRVVHVWESSRASSTGMEPNTYISPPIWSASPSVATTSSMSSTPRSCRKATTVGPARGLPPSTSTSSPLGRWSQHESPWTTSMKWAARRLASACVCGEGTTMMRSIARPTSTSKRSSLADSHLVCTGQQPPPATAEGRAAQPSSVARAVSVHQG